MYSTIQKNKRITYANKSIHLFNNSNDSYQLCKEIETFSTSFLVSKFVQIQLWSPKTLYSIAHEPILSNLS